MGAPPQVKHAWEQNDEHSPSASSALRTGIFSPSAQRDGIYAPLTLFMNTLSSFHHSTSHAQKSDPDTRVEKCLPWTKAAAPPIISRGPPPLTSEMLNNQPLSLREAHFPNVYCKGFCKSVGNVTINRNVIEAKKPAYGEPQAVQGIAIGNGLAPLARAVDPSSGTQSFARVVQRGRLVQLKIEGLTIPHLNLLRWCHRLVMPKTSEKRPSFLSGISIGLSTTSDLDASLPLELHEGVVCVSDDLSVWVKGIKVRDRFDAQYTEHGILFDNAKQGQIVSVLFALNRVVVYSDKWPLLSFAFDADKDVAYQSILSCTRLNGRLGRLDGDVWPIIQLRPPVLRVIWHPDNSREPLRALQFHRQATPRSRADVEEGLTLPDGFAVRDVRSRGNWEPPRTLTNDTLDIWGQTRPDGSVDRCVRGDDHGFPAVNTRGMARSGTWGTWGTWRGINTWASAWVRKTGFTATFLSTFLTSAYGIFQWRKVQKPALSAKEERALATKRRRFTLTRWMCWALIIMGLVIAYFFYFPNQRDAKQPWYRNWLIGLTIVICVTLVCLIPNYCHVLSKEEYKEERGNCCCIESCLYA
eukprot:GEMP01021379.1.p1 GENE.GEMP01021379.1~~GEMP01021379.1.p1  ORF type:complete len:583 (+),score=116.50 GEMP01021379.1:321-2069(+)